MDAVDMEDVISDWSFTFSNGGNTKMGRVYGQNLLDLSFLCCKFCFR